MKEIGGVTGSGYGSLDAIFIQDKPSSSSPATNAVDSFSSGRQNTVVQEEWKRVEKEYHKSNWRYMKEKLIGAATLSTVDKTPAVQLLKHKSLSLDAAKDIIAGWLWEQRKRTPENIDVAALAAVVHAIEKKRAERKEHGLIPLALHDPGWWRCPGAIQGWIDAFRLTDDISVEQVRHAFGHGGAGYEQRGKSIFIGLLGSAVSIGMLPVTESWTLSSSAVLRAMGASKQLHWDLKVGKERLKRKPREDLGPLINLKASSRAGAAPRMTAAVRMAADLREASALNRKLKTAMDNGDADTVDELLEQATRMLSEKEEPVKATLNNSAVEWNGNKFQMMARGTAAALGVAGGAAGIALSGGASLPVVVPLTAVAIGTHLGYHFADGAKHDSANKLETAFLGRIKTYDWVNTKNMTPGEIAKAYEQYQDKDALRELLHKKEAFDLKSVCDATQLPFTVRLDIARKLLVGKFEQYRNKACVAGHRAEALRKQLAACGRGSPLRALLQSRLDKAFARHEKYRALLQKTGVDCVNMAAAWDVMKGAVQSEDGAALLDYGAELLAAVGDRHVCDLFCGSLKAQARAGALERKLKQGEYDKYLLSYMASSTLSSAIGASTVTAGIAYQQGVCLDHWADLGYPLESPIPPVRILKPLSAATAAVGAVASTMAPVVSGLRPPFSREYPFRAAQGENAMSIALSGQGVCAPEWFDDSVMQQLMTDEAPATLEIGFRDRDGNHRRVCLRLGETQPHVEARLRKQGLEKQYRTHRIKTWARLLVDGVKSNLNRPRLTSRMRATRDARRELRSNIDKARAFLSVAHALAKLPRNGSGILKGKEADLSRTEQASIYTPEKYPIIRTHPNAGGVNSLFLALGIPKDEIPATRKAIADLVRDRTDGVESEVRNLESLREALFATPGLSNATGWLDEVTQLSNTRYADLQEETELHAGYDMLEHYMAQACNEDKAVGVIDSNGMLTIHAGSAKQTYNKCLPGRSPEESLNELLKASDIALYKSGSRWEEIVLAH